MTEPLSLNLNPAKATAGSGIADFGGTIASDPATGEVFGKLLAASLVPDQSAAALPVTPDVAGKLPETGKTLPTMPIPANLMVTGTSEEIASPVTGSRELPRALPAKNGSGKIELMAKAMPKAGLAQPVAIDDTTTDTGDEADTAPTDTSEDETRSAAQALPVPTQSPAQPVFEAIQLPAAPVNPLRPEPSQVARKAASASDDVAAASRPEAPAVNRTMPTSVVEIADIAQPVLAATVLAAPALPAPAFTAPTLAVPVIAITVPAVLPGTVVTTPAEIRARPVIAKSDAPAKSINAVGTENTLNGRSTSDSNLSAIAAPSASPSGQGDDGSGQPPMARQSAHSPAGPSAIVSPETSSSGPATPLIVPSPAFAPVQTPIAALAAPSQLPAAHDMASLVDRLVEARAAARVSGSPTTVATSVRHAEFGQVSLRFETSGKDLTVSMASSDPGFAPAAQAALAASPVAAADSSSSTSTSTGQQSGAQSQHNASQSGWTLAQQNPGRQQPRPQGQTVPGSFAAASRTPASNADSTAAGAPAQSGVFA